MAGRSASTIRWTCTLRGAETDGAADSHAIFSRPVHQAHNALQGGARKKMQVPGTRFSHQSADWWEKRFFGQWGTGTFREISTLKSQGAFRRSESASARQKSVYQYNDQQRDHDANKDVNRAQFQWNACVQAVAPRLRLGRLTRWRLLRVRYTFKTVSLESDSGISMEIVWTIEF
jgi:hypothetical protein